MLSFVPRCHGLWGSAKNTCTPDSTVKRAWSDSSLPRSQVNDCHRWVGSLVTAKEKRRIVMVLREIHPEKGFGAVRTRVVVATAESEKAATFLARKLVQSKSRIMTNENAAYSALASWYEHKTVENSLMFSGPEGEN